MQSFLRSIGLSFSEMSRSRQITLTANDRRIETFIQLCNFSFRPGPANKLSASLTSPVPDIQRQLESYARYRELPGMCHQHADGVRPRRAPTCIVVLFLCFPSSFFSLGARGDVSLAASCNVTRFLVLQRYLKLPSSTNRHPLSIL